MIVLVGGGSRSGKSRYGLELARRFTPPLAFIATAETLDDEMNARAAAHQAERGPEFVTIEEPVELAAALQKAVATHNAVIVDCLTLWASNLMLRERNACSEAAPVLQLATAAPVPVIFISNEVGCGIVPENELARRFRDEAGKLNQIVAGAADEVWWMAFGIPVRLK